MQGYNDVLDTVNPRQKKPTLHELGYGTNRDEKIRTLHDGLVVAGRFSAAVQG